MILRRGLEAPARRLKSTGQSRSAHHLHHPTTNLVYSEDAWHGAQAAPFLPFLHSSILWGPRQSWQICLYLHSEAFERQTPRFHLSQGSSHLKSDLPLAFPFASPVRVPAPMGLSQYNLRSSNWERSVSSRSRRSPTRTRMALSSAMTLAWWQGNVAEKRERIRTPYVSSSDLRWGKANEAAFTYK